MNKKNAHYYDLPGACCWYLWQPSLSQLFCLTTCGLTGGEFDESAACCSDLPGTGPLTMEIQNVPALLIVAYSCMNVSKTVLVLFDGACFFFWLLFFVFVFPESMAKGSSAGFT